MERITLVGMLSLAGCTLSYCGQLHVVVRFMALRRREDVKTSRCIALVWSAVTLGAAVAVGALGYYLFGGELDNSEPVFIALSSVMLTLWVAGFVLAEVLAAIMRRSTPSG